MSYIATSSATHKCDEKKAGFVEGWYRFKGNAGTAMADTCVTKAGSCGTLLPGWLQVKYIVDTLFVCFDHKWHA
jgi:hypothetical protein